MKTVLAISSAVVAVALASSAAKAVDYVVPTQVDLLRHVNADGVFDVNAQWTNLSTGAGVTWPAYNGIDGGSWATQVGYGGPTPISSSSAASYQITLPQAVTIQSLQFTYAGYNADQYSLSVSTTGFGSMTPITTNFATPVSGTYSNTVNQSVRYIQYDFKGNTNLNQPYLLIEEFKATSPAAAQISTTSGYDIFAQSPANGGPGPIPNNPLYVGPGWIDDVNNTIDLNPDTYARPGAVPTYFVVPLNGSYNLNAFAVGFYHGQNWNDLEIDYTNDPTISFSTVWQTAFVQNTAVFPETLPFQTADGRIQATFVRVRDLTPTGNAMTNFELFAVPEPTTLGVLGVGMVGLVARRKR